MNSDGPIVAETKNGHIIFPEYVAVAAAPDELLEDPDYDPEKFVRELIGSNIVYEGYLRIDKEERCICCKAFTLNMSSTISKPKRTAQT
ncbi:hypothetical protein [Saccharibacillus qingshengii]|uniref:hypothetical protein n=1 Tax=Saccharibacillus qingshengii TaxID=1763540 RepID=UPI001555CD07|nr:hypothetical protein [Saccharibacillus qingshengii]